MTRQDASAPDPLRDRWFLDTLMRFHVTGEESGGAFSVVEQRLPKGFSPPRHVHAHEDGVLYVLEGALTVEVGGALRTVRAGECAFLPKGVVHTFVGDAPSRILEVTTPGGIDAFYAENGAPAERLELPPPGAPDVERLAATAEARAVAIVGPPLEPR